MQKEQIKLFYIVSSNNNPTGVSLDNSIKSKLVNLCAKNDILIVDDRAYGEISFASTPQLSLSEADPNEYIIEIGTFSKTIATGIRVAWIIASDSVITKLDTMRFDNGGSNLMQRVVHNFVSSKNYLSHLEHIRNVYEEKRDISAHALEKYCGNKIDFSIPNGGFYHWLKINNGIENEILRKRALQKGVGINSGNIYYVNEDDKEHLRLVFSKLNSSDLENAIQILNNLKNELKSSTSVIVTHYSGLTVDQAEGLRKEMRNNGAKFKVTKNRLTKLALEETNFKDLANLFSGPTAIAYSNDPVAPPRALPKAFLA